MDATTLNPFDAATRIIAADGRITGHTHDGFWAFVGPFGGATAAVLLRAVIEHPDRLGDPLALTVNYCAPIAKGPFDLNVKLIKPNRSSQHWSVELIQNGEVAAFATAISAIRRQSWSHRPKAMPQVTPYDATPIHPDGKIPWVQQYQFRFAEGAPEGRGPPNNAPASTYSKLWIRDAVPRRIDALSLAAMCDAFFARIFHARRGMVPFGTVSMTLYIHADAEELRNMSTDHVLGVADASIFHKSYGDQIGELWSPDGWLLATTQQVTYFKV